ncbi:hypothetical protein FRC02_009164 [Tulasnella sp. 418]|nr:hypothetical protein FRC02_009164 [Tulasnella sp. 418]
MQGFVNHKAKSKVDNDGRSYAMCDNKTCPHRLQALTRGKRDKPEWFWWFDATHPSVSFYPSPRNHHPPIQPQPMVPHADSLASTHFPL